MSIPDRFANLSPLKRALLAIDELQARLDASENATREPVAIIGIGCRLPGGVDSPEAFWRLLQAGESAIREIPTGRWDDASEAPRLGGFLDDVDRFDAAFFGIAPREAESMDPQQRVLLEVIWEALEYAGQAPDRLAGTRTGVYVGICSNEYFDLFKDRDLSERSGHEASGVAHSIASGRVSYLLGLQGPAVSIDTACSSSLVALHLACQSLRLGETRMAIVAGVSLLLQPDTNAVFAKAGMLAPDGRCKTFDAAADGYTRSEGCAAVVVKRLRDAIADGDRILGIVRGSAVNQDGPSSGLTAPNGPAQEAVIREAIANAGVAALDVSYVEAHGTGTALGDPIEIQALAAALGHGRDADRPLLVGSVKTNVGHMEAAAGLGGLIKVLLAIQHRQIPPHLNFATPNPLIDWASIPIAVPTETVAWQSRDGRRRIAGVSSFGFSGTNAHVVVEEAPEPSTESASNHDALVRPIHILAVSANSPAALRRRLSMFAGRIASASHEELPDICYTANARRAHHTHRVAIAARSLADAHGQLEALGKAGASTHARQAIVRTADRPRVAFLFTGQGAQAVRMGATLYETQPVYRDAMDHCADALRPHLRADIRTIIESDQARLDHTAWTQSALFAVGYALATLWQAWGVTPSAVLGHSIGEITGATIAGALTLEDAARLVARRGLLMGSLPEGGAMAAIMADEARVRAALAGRALGVDVAAVNGPANVVVSGAADAVDTVLAAFAADGVTTKRLAVSHAFHSPLLDPILDAFEAEGTTVAHRPPSMTVISNITGKAIANGSWNATYWRAHARSAVRFADGVRTLYEQGFRVFVECGPHPTLIGLAMQTITDPGVSWLPSLRRGHDDWEQMSSSLAQAYLANVPIEWEGVDRGYRRRIVTLPTYPFDRERFWVRAPSRRAPRGERPAHPLLGTRLSSPALTARVFECALDRNVAGYLYDHRVLEQPIMPAAGFVEMALAAGAERAGQRQLALRDLFVHAVLPLSSDGMLVAQTIVRERPDGDGEVEIVSRLVAAAPDAPWTVHASARLGTCQEFRWPLDGLAAARERCSTALSRESFYDGVAARGVQFGPAFRGLRELWMGDGEAVARLALADGVTAGSEYVMHPALLDAAIQVVAAVASERTPSRDLFLPVGADHIAITETSARTAWAHAELEPIDLGSGMLSARVRLFDEEGAPAGELSGLRFRRADRSMLARLQPDRVAEWMYETNWEDAGPAIASGGVARPWRDDVGPIAAAYAADPALATYREVTAYLESRSVSHILSAFTALGFELREGHHLDAGIIVRAGIAHDRVRLFERLLGILRDARILKHDATGWRVCELPGHHVRTAPPVADSSGESALLERCGSRLADVLSGRCNPLDLLFPNASQELVERIYRDSPVAHAFHEMFTATVRSLAAASSSRPLRILEVGGGTGSTTTAVINALAGVRAEYLFTDISPLFVARARDTFGTVDFVRYQALDVERDLTAQGVSAASIDLVIASDVVHATRDVAETLTNICAVLRPGGALAMIEVTRAQRWIDLTFGLTDGWWRFADRERRPEHPLLDRQQWTKLLAATGFAHAATVPADSDESASLENSIIVAYRRADVRLSTGRRWLLFGDRVGIAERVARELAERGDVCSIVTAAERGAAGATGECIDPRDAASYDRAIRDAAPDAAIVYCWALDAPDPDDDPSIGQERMCGGLLLLVQSLARIQGAAKPRLWVVTAGAQSVDGTADAARPDAATLWGLANVVTVEHSELRCARVDLDPAIDTDRQATALLAEVLADDAEDRVAHRNGRRRVARLERALLVDAAESYALVVRERGSTDQLEFAPMVRQPPAAGQVEIRARASGLNFRDVLNVLGLYPGAPPLGGECAGVITRVGPGVTQVSVGDEVVAIAEGSLSSHVLADARFVAPSPMRLTAAQAATIPVAYVTAAFALEHLGRIRPGQRVLIHAAAGGVGLAAVHLAHRAGAEVFATASSDAKHRLLRSLGVQHVMNSRSTAFAAEILVATDGRGVDLVLNSLSGEMIDASFAALATGGTFLEIGKSGVWSPDRVAALGRGIIYHVIDWGSTAIHDPDLIGGLFRDLLARVDEGALPPLPLHLFEMTDVADVFRTMAQGRHVGKLVLRHPPTAEAVCRHEGTYLVTGGLGPLGLRTADWLASGGARHLVLAGRSRPSEDATRAIHNLRARGVAVSVANLDVVDRAAVSALLADVRRLGPPLRGVVHAAGTLADGILLNQRWSQFDRVFQAKVYGTTILDELTADDPLEFFVMYSSSAGVFGSPAQGNHAAASSFEDAVASHRRARNLPATTISWGAWGEIGMGAQYRVDQRRAAAGTQYMDPDLALEAGGRVLRAGAAHRIVTAMDWNTFATQSPLRAEPFFKRWVGATDPAPTPGSVVERENVLERLRTAPAQRRRKLLLEFVRSVSARVLGLSSADRLGDRIPLREHGLDSLMAVELRNVVARSLDADLPATLLFDYPTPEALAEHLESLLTPVPAPEGEATEEPDDVLRAIDDLSDAEVDRLLAERMGRRG